MGWGVRCEGEGFREQRLAGLFFLRGVLRGMMPAKVVLFWGVLCVSR